MATAWITISCFKGSSQLEAIPFRSMPGKQFQELWGRGGWWDPKVESKVWMSFSGAQFKSVVCYCGTSCQVRRPWKQRVSLPLAGQVWGSISLPASLHLSLSLLLCPTLLREAVLDLVAIPVTILGWIRHRLKPVAVIICLCPPN